jgi:hypothetical protein
MRTRLVFGLYAMLGLASVLLPAPIAAQAAEVRVTGAGEAAFPSGAAFNGVSLRGLELGQGVLIAPDGSASGHFHATLSGTSFLGLPQAIIVEGKVNQGSVESGGVSFNGIATVDIGDGTAPLLDVAFYVTASTGTVQLVLGGTTLPAATLTGGSITIE